MKAAGWSGIMSLPRVLTLDKDGTLRIRSLPQLSALRGAQLRVTEGKTVLPAFAAALTPHRLRFVPVSMRD